MLLPSVKLHAGILDTPLELLPNRPLNRESRPPNWITLLLRILTIRLSLPAPRGILPTGPLTQFLFINRERADNKLETELVARYDLTPLASSTEELLTLRKESLDNDNGLHALLLTPKQQTVPHTLILNLLSPVPPDRQLSNLGQELVAHYLLAEAEHIKILGSNLNLCTRLSLQGLNRRLLNLIKQRALTPPPIPTPPKPSPFHPRRSSVSQLTCYSHP